MLQKVIAGLAADLREKTEPKNPAAEISAPELLAENISLENKLEFLRGQLAGSEAEELTVFGRIRQLYADYTAQGKQLDFLIEYEKWFDRRFGNTHTKGNLTADFSHTAFNSLIALIHKALKADEKNYIVLPVGQGASGALERLHKILGLDIAPAALERVAGAGRTRLLELKNQLKRFAEQKSRWETKYKETRREEDKKWLPAEIDALDEGIAAVNKLSDDWIKEFIPARYRPVVLITGQEHHGNTLPYDGTLADKIIVPFVSGTVDIDLAAYEKLLQDLRAQGRKIIVSFSAASNVTGQLTDIQTTAALAKKYGALTIYDYAAALAYVPIDLSPRTEDGHPLIDAVVASPHKLPGGPGSAGLLVFNKAIYPAQLYPTNKAGGTVWHVSLWDVEYSRDILERELSGTPNGLGILRLGLAIDLTYNVIGFANIQKIERKLSEPLFDYLRGEPNILLYGDQELEKRAPIFSFNIKQGGGVLHPNFVARALSDLFGIQTRPGCSCAGEYGHYLLQISRENSRLMLDKVREGIFAGKPGWVRLNPHWLFTAEQVSYITEAIKLLSVHGHKLLSLYELDIDGHYRFKDIFKDPKYIDVNVVDAENASVAQAAGIFRQRQLLAVQAQPAGGKYAYRRALLDQLENAEIFLNALPDNTDRLQTLTPEKHGAPLPLLYESLTPEFQDRLDELERQQFAVPQTTALAAAAGGY
ncbi:MAG: aminotransferase class V-fold PLP-dependent enzyme [Candidatus Margulisbacteria bacterium]|jgi:selenocysteine lyase/cysteine desulfurase|nr:aminotransferase class V-fold PLP-dependent enzyme [Candidatus Margulisiibacteriota bacterium]